MSGLFFFAPPAEAAASCAAGMDHAPAADHSEGIPERRATPWPSRWRLRSPSRIGRLVMPQPASTSRSALSAPIPASAMVASETMCRLAGERDTSKIDKSLCSTPKTRDRRLFLIVFDLFLRYLFVACP
jgi:hypothetical protein